MPLLFPLGYILLTEMVGNHGCKTRIKQFSSVFNFFRSKMQLASVVFLLFLALRSVSFWPQPPGAPLALRRVEPRFKDDSATVASASRQRRLRMHPRCAMTISRLVTNSDSVGERGVMAGSIGVEHR